MCCRGKDGTCTPFILNNGSFLYLRKGKPCTVGFCDEGVRLLIYLCSLKPFKEFKPMTDFSLSYFLKQGKCMKQVQDVIERLWDFIDKLDINTFGELLEQYKSNSMRKTFLFLSTPFSSLGKFLADNIVGSVVVFSLIFWIPLSILVHCVVRTSRISPIMPSSVTLSQPQPQYKFADTLIFFLPLHRTKNLINSTRRTNTTL